MGATGFDRGVDSQVHLVANLFYGDFSMKPSTIASALGKSLCVNTVLCSILSMFLCLQVYYEKGLVLILIIGVVGNSVLLAIAPTFWKILAPRQLLAASWPHMLSLTSQKMNHVS